jgi:hypothetical protein
MELKPNRASVPWPMLQAQILVVEGDRFAFKNPVEL